MKSEIFPIVLLLVLGLIYTGISAAVVVLVYKQKGIFYLFTFLCTTGADPGFFRRGCTRLLLYFNTNKPHSFFAEYQLY